MRTLFAIAFLIAPFTFASAYEVFPVRLYVDASRNTTTLTITNTNADDIVVQPRVLIWQQGESAPKSKDDVGELSATTDFQIFPNVVQLKPGAKQTIRLRYTGKFDPNRELSYRVIAEEIVSKQTGSIVNFARAMSIPIFVRPLSDSAPTLKWPVKKAASGAYELVAENPGNIHLQITKLSARRLLPDGTKAANTVDVSLFAYLLPGSKQTIALPTIELAAGRYELVLTTDYAPLEATIDLP